MAANTKLVEERKQVKSRKPTYKRVQANQYAKFANDEKWRRPKGKGNKDRRNRKGHIGMIKHGYSSPSAIKGMNKDGLLEVLVSNVSDLAKVDSKDKIAVISGTVGNRKKIEILKEAKSKSIDIANVKNIDDTIKALTKTPKKAEKSAKKETKEAEKKQTPKTEENVEEKKEASKDGGKKE
ncbi:MAG: eL32 family ribosomal protein [Nanoarchaeota archaeon]